MNLVLIVSLILAVLVSDCVVYGSSAEEDPLVTEQCCSNGETFALTASSVQACSAIELPEDVDLEQADFCRNSMKSCCQEHMKKKEDCNAGLRFAPEKRCSVPKTDMGKTCCEECSFGKLTGESQGKEACGGPAEEYDSPSSALRKNVYYQCCVDAAEHPPTTTTTTTTTTKKPETTTQRREKCKSNSCDQLCDDSDGRITCRCRDGFRLQSDKKTCKDINECAETLDDLCAKEGTVCHNTPGSFKCVPLKKRDVSRSCPPGYKRNVKNQVCDDINECQLPRPPCPKYLCENSIGGYTCAGKPGKPAIDPEGGFVAPEPSNPAADEDPDEAPKMDVCPSGFRVGDDDECADIDECEERLDDCQRLSQHCINSHGSYFCQDHVSKRCAPGFKVNTATGVCEDIDECEESSEVCKRTEICVNLPGAYNCKSKISTLPQLTPTGTSNKNCPEGTRRSSGGKCEDIDECREGSHLCEPFQNCINTYGAHECRCKNGFEMDSQSNSCVDIDECALKLDSCTGELHCLNVPGSYTCTRRPPTTTTTTESPFEYYYTDEEELDENGSIPESKPTTTTTTPRIQTRPTTATTISTTERLYPTRPTTPRYPYPTYPKTTSTTTERSRYSPYTERPTVTTTERSRHPENPRNYNRSNDRTFTTSTQRTTYPEYPERNNNRSPFIPPPPPSLPPRPDSRYPNSSSNIPPTPPRPDLYPSSRHPTSTSTRSPPYTNRPNRPYSTSTSTTEVPRRPEIFDNIDTPDRRANRIPNESEDKFDPALVRCLYGYERNAYGQCVDMNECETGRHVCRSLEACRNTPGGYSCDCIPGYRRDPSGNCVAEGRPAVTITRTSTSTTSTTTERTTSAPLVPVWVNPPRRERPPSTADCDFGYSPDYYGNCIDIDECATNTANCRPEEECVNTEGGFECNCLGSCRHADRISPTPARPSYEVIPSRSPPRAPTTFTVGRQYGQRGPMYIRPTYSTWPGSSGYTTACPWGYKLTPDKQCLDIDECAKNISECGSQQVCENFYGGYYCGCPKGHRMVNHNQCEDIDECAYGNVCSQTGRCINTIGSFHCECGEGFRTPPSNDKMCVDIDECSETPQVCEQACANSWGGYRCFCNRGYRLRSDNRTCEDIDECAEFSSTNRRLCSGQCVNTQGSYKCSCPAGYKLSADGASCTDIDECQTGVASCAKSREPNEVCTNTRGSYHCHRIACPAGYKLEGKHRCTRIQRMCQYNDWECLQQPGSYSYNFLTFVANIYLPSGSVDLFTMQGPQWSDSVATFEMKLIDAQPGPGVRPATLSCFDMRPSVNRCVVSLLCPLQGPQVAELELKMAMYRQGQFSGSAVARLIIIVSEYEF